MCPPAPLQLRGAYYLRPPDARAIFLHNDLLCNWGGGITYWGGTNEKDPISVSIFVNMKCVEIDPFDLKDKEMRLDYEKL